MIKYLNIFLVHGSRGFDKKVGLGSSKDISLFCGNTAEKRNVSFDSVSRQFPYNQGKTGHEKCEHDQENHGEFEVVKDVTIWTKSYKVNFMNVVEINLSTTF